MSKLRNLIITIRLSGVLTFAICLIFENVYIKQQNLLWFLFKIIHETFYLWKKCIDHVKVRWWRLPVELTPTEFITLLKLIDQMIYVFVRCWILNITNLGDDIKTKLIWYRNEIITIWNSLHHWEQTRFHY